MEHTAEIVTTLLFLGLSTWAAISTFIVRPDKEIKTDNWALASRYGIVAVFFGMMTVLVTPLSNLI